MFLEEFHAWRSSHSIRVCLLRVPPMLLRSGSRSLRRVCSGRFPLQFPAICSSCSCRSISPLLTDCRRFRLDSRSLSRCCSTVHADVRTGVPVTSYHTYINHTIERAEDKPLPTPWRSASPEGIMEVSVLFCRNIIARLSTHVRERLLVKITVAVDPRIPVILWGVISEECSSPVSQ